MVQELDNVYENFKKLKETIFKLAIDKRTEERLSQYFLKAKELYQEYLRCSVNLDTKIENNEIKGSDIIHIKELCTRTEYLYYQIEGFCTQKTSSSTSSSVVEEHTMTSFDLKTATSLLPVMTGGEDVTKQLISAIELYCTMLKTDNQNHLIQFVLKTRLSESAKLRLNETYDSVTSLVSDMKQHLLTKQSATALHSQLARARQNSSTIDEFGQQLEDLFVKLTISQADGDQSAYKILKPINEKLAVQRFTDGLRNRHLSTILAARNFTELKNAIRAAKDEELSSSRSEGEDSLCMAHQGNTNPQNHNIYNHFYNSRPRSYAGHRGGRGGSSRPYRGYEYVPREPRFIPRQGRGDGASRGNFTTRTFTRGQQQGRYNAYRSGRGNSNHHNMHFLNAPENAPSNNDTQNEELEFFRP